MIGSLFYNFGVASSIAYYSAILGTHKFWGGGGSIFEASCEVTWFKYGSTFVLGHKCKWITKITCFVKIELFLFVNYGLDLLFPILMNFTCLWFKLFDS